MRAQLAAFQSRQTYIRTAELAAPAPTSRSSSVSIKPGYNYSLNGYRGFCALTVFLYHVAISKVVPIDAYGETYAFVATSLRYGVEMFFMISGFVILGSVKRHTSVFAFLRDRFIRIYSAWAPSVAVVTAVCAGFSMKMFETSTPLEAAGVVIANFFLLPPFVHVPWVNSASWSLTYEWVFYFGAAAGSLLLRTDSRAPRWLSALWALSLATFVCLFPRSLFFMTGVLISTYSAWFERRKSWLRFPWLSLVVFIGAWRLTGADSAQLTETMFDWARDGRLVYAAIAFVASVHMFASVALQASSAFAFLKRPMFQFLGDISYSFYLWHAPVVSLVKRVVLKLLPGADAWITLLCIGVFALALTIPVSWLSLRYFEGGLSKKMRDSLVPPQPTPALQRLTRARQPVDADC
jgi:peptidoglycan/LPS O-acetylase OafA/YrhL